MGRLRSGSGGSGSVFFGSGIFLVQGTKAFQREYHMYIVWQKYSKINFYCTYCKSKFQIYIYVLYYVLNLFQTTKAVVLFFYKARIVLTIYMKICFYVRKQKIHTRTKVQWLQNLFEKEEEGAREGPRIRQKQKNESKQKLERRK